MLSIDPAAGYFAKTWTFKLLWCQVLHTLSWTLEQWLYWGHSISAPTWIHYSYHDMFNSLVWFTTYDSATTEYLERSNFGNIQKHESKRKAKSQERSLLAKMKSSKR